MSYILLSHFCTVGIEVATSKEQLQCIASMCVTFISTKPPIYEHHVHAVLISYPGPLHALRPAPCTLFVTGSTKRGRIADPNGTYLETHNYRLLNIVLL